MKKNVLKFLGYTAAVAGLTLLVTEPAIAQVGVNKLSDHLSDQFKGVMTIFSGACYIAGFGFGLKCALKLKESNESKGQIPISQPVTLGIVAAILLALPTFLGLASEGAFGTKDNGASIGGSNFETLK